jgi:hypothetical protein
MDPHLQTLKRMENDLLIELRRMPVFIKLESLRKTIKDFESNDAIGIAQLNHVDLRSPNLTVYAITGLNVPPVYDPARITWKERIAYILNENQPLMLSEIIRRIQQLEPKHDKKFLDKRIGVTVSHLKTEGLINAESSDGKFRYSLK